MDSPPPIPAPATSTAPTVTLPIFPAPEAGAAFVSRLIAALAITMIAFAVCTPYFSAATQWIAREWRVLPAFSVFVLTSVVAVIVQGARAPARMIFYSGALCAALALLLPALMGPAERNDIALSVTMVAPRAAAADREHTDKTDHEEPRAEAASAAGGLMQRRDASRDWLCFAASLFSAVLLGTLLGRGIAAPLHFLAFLLCAVVGNAWLTQMHVLSGAGGGISGLQDLIRLPWPTPSSGRIGLTCLEAGVIAATLEAARHLRLHLLSILCGSAAGFCGGAFLALEPWPGWVVMPAIMTGMGTAIAAWPDLRFTRRDTAQALLCAMSLLVALTGLVLIRRHIAPDIPPSGNEQLRLRGST